MKIKYFDVPRLVMNMWGKSYYSTAPEIVFCCKDAADAPALFDVSISEETIVATLQDLRDGEPVGVPFRCCPWCGTPINEEGS